MTCANENPMISVSSNVDIDVCLLNAEVAGMSIVQWSMNRVCKMFFCSDPLNLAISENANAVSIYAKGMSLQSP